MPHQIHSSFLGLAREILTLYNNLFLDDNSIPHMTDEDQAGMLELVEAARNLADLSDEPLAGPILDMIAQQLGGYQDRE